MIYNLLLHQQWPTMDHIIHENFLDIFIPSDGWSREHVNDHALYFIALRAVLLQKCRIFALSTLPNHLVRA